MRKDPLLFEKWIFCIDQRDRDDDGRMFVASLGCFQFVNLTSHKEV